MEITLLKEKKQQLEQDMKNCIDSFIEDTGIDTLDIEILKLEMIGSSCKYIVQVRVEL